MGDWVDTELSVVTELSVGMELSVVTEPSVVTEDVTWDTVTTEDTATVCMEDRGTAMDTAMDMVALLVTEASDPETDLEEEWEDITNIVSVLNLHVNIYRCKIKCSKYSKWELHFK